MNEETQGATSDATGSGSRDGSAGTVLLLEADCSMELFAGFFGIDANGTQPTEKANLSTPVHTDCYVVWELSETEYWDDAWNRLGLFTSRQLAELARQKREALMKRDFDEDVGNFEDWYSWMITPAQLSGNPGELEAT